MKMLLEWAFEIRGSIDGDNKYDKRWTFAIGQNTTLCWMSQRFLCLMCHSRSSWLHCSSAWCSSQTALTTSLLSSISLEKICLKAVSNWLLGGVWPSSVLLDSAASSRSERESSLTRLVLTAATRLEVRGDSRARWRSRLMKTRGRERRRQASSSTCFLLRIRRTKASIVWLWPSLCPNCSVSAQTN